MNRHEAIRNLKGIKDFYGDDSKDGYAQEFVALDKYEKEAIDMAIEALCDDAVSISKVLEVFSDIYWFDDDSPVVSKEDVDKIYERLRQLQPVTATERTGE